MAGVVMEFDMGAETPRGGSKGQEARKRAAAAEAFTQGSRHAAAGDARCGKFRDRLAGRTM